MGFQFIVRSDDVDAIRTCLGDVAEHTELFVVWPGSFGVSIPTKIVDKVGYETILERLHPLRWYDLCDGVWTG